MTPQSAPDRRAVRVHLLLQGFIAVTFFVGVWLVTTAVLVHSSLRVLVSQTFPIGFFRAGGLFPILSIVAGMWFVVAAVSIWMRCSPSRIRQLLATLFFLPGVWVIVWFVQWISDRHFGWSILAVPIALVIRALCYELADGISARLSHGGKHVVA